MKRNYQGMFILLLVLALAMILTSCSRRYGEDDLANFRYRIGDRGPAGGTIFYIDFENEFPWSYLEAAPDSARAESVAWAPGPFEIVTGLRMGDGQQNTARLVDHFTATGYEQSAAQLASHLVVRGYDDWFLPSLEELREMMRQSRHIDGLPRFFAGRHWSSSIRYGNNPFWISRPDNSGETSYRRTFTVWPVRAF